MSQVSLNLQWMFKVTTKVRIIEFISHLSDALLVQRSPKFYTAPYQLFFFFLHPAVNVLEDSKCLLAVTYEKPRHHIKLIVDRAVVRAKCEVAE